MESKGRPSYKQIISFDEPYNEIKELVKIGLEKEGKYDGADAPSNEEEKSSKEITLEILKELRKNAEITRRNYELSQRMASDLRDVRKEIILTKDLLRNAIIKYPLQLIQLVTIFIATFSGILLLLNRITNQVIILKDVGVSLLIFSVGLFIVSVLRNYEIKRYQ